MVRRSAGKGQGGKSAAEDNSEQGIADPGGGKMDDISCRNDRIYSYPFMAEPTEGAGSWDGDRDREKKIEFIGIFRPDLAISDGA